MSSQMQDEAEKEKERRLNGRLAKLQDALKNKSLVIIVGAGVSLSATAMGPGELLLRITWKGLIENGLDYLVCYHYVERSHPQMKKAYEALRETDTENLLTAAGIMRSQLDEVRQFPTWLDTVFRHLDKEIRFPAILDALKALYTRGAKLLTTNYDDLLEEYCGVIRIGNSDQDQLQKFKRGEVSGVLHVHGSFRDPRDVVLDASDYSKIKNADEIQDILKKFLGWDTILFIGCGSGLEDPNFDALLKWASDKDKNLPDRHVLLLRDNDRLNYQPLIPLRYGHEYEDLVPFLQRLLEPTSPGSDRPLLNRKAQTFSEGESQRQTRTQAPFNRSNTYPKRDGQDFTMSADQPCVLRRKPAESVRSSDSLVSNGTLEKGKTTSFDTPRTSNDASILTVESPPTRSSSPDLSALSQMLIAAIQLTSPKAVREQLKKGANVLAQDSDGWTALHHAVKAGGRRVLHELLNSEGLVNNPKGIDKPDKTGATPLHHAASAGNLEFVNELLKKDAFIDATDRFGRSPLHMAVKGNHESLVELLLGRGAAVTENFPRRVHEIQNAIQLRKHRQEKEARRNKH